MIGLLITLILVVLLWYAVRTLFASHPRPVLLVIDVLFLVFVVAFVARFLGLL